MRLLCSRRRLARAFFACLQVHQARGCNGRIGMIDDSAVAAAAAAAATAAAAAVYERARATRHSFEGPFTIMPDQMTLTNPLIILAMVTIVAFISIKAQKKNVNQSLREQNSAFFDKSIRRNWRIFFL